MQTSQIYFPFKYVEAINTINADFEAVVKQSKFYLHLNVEKTQHCFSGVKKTIFIPTNTKRFLCDSLVLSHFNFF